MLGSVPSCPGLNVAVGWTSLGGSISGKAFKTSRDKMIYKVEEVQMNHREEAERL